MGKKKEKAGKGQSSKGLHSSKSTYKKRWQTKPANNILNIVTGYSGTTLKEKSQRFSGHYFI